MAARNACWPLPAPGLIWWRAEIERVRRARTESARPVAFVYAASCVVAAAIVLIPGGAGIVGWLAAPASVAAAVLVGKLYSDAPQR